MRVAQRIQQQWSKKPISLKDQQIEFVFKKARKLTREERIAQSKAIWMGGTGNKGVLDGD